VAEPAAAAQPGGPERLLGLSAWLRAPLAGVAGAVSALAFAPHHHLAAAVAGYTLLILLLERERRGWRAFALGWLFGFGQFVVGLNWIGNALLVDAQRFAWLMPFTVAGVPAGLAVFPATGIWLAWKASPGGGVGRIVALAAAWPLAEWLRASLLTGFPWNHAGYVWGASEPLLQAAALVGVHGLAAAAVLAAAAPAAMLTARPRPAAALLATVLALAGAAWAWGIHRLAAAPPPDTGLRVRVVQPNVDQSEKWRPELRQRNVAILERLSVDGNRDFDVLVWPETAPPFLVADDPGYRRRAADLLPPGAVLLTGSVRIAAGDGRERVYNSLVALDAEARVLASYDKHHLVPFGEYLPLRPLLGRLGFSRIVESRADFSPGPGPQVLDLPGLPPFQPLICYEIVFADEVGVPRRPGWLLAVTNDGWFGISAGPYQHFEMARMRAVEQGVPLVRAANTGISGAVDAHGRVLASLALGSEGRLDLRLPAPLPAPTLFSQLGAAVLLPFPGLLALLWIAGRRRPEGRG